MFSRRVVGRIVRAALRRMSVMGNLIVGTAGFERFGRRRYGLVASVAGAALVVALVAGVPFQVNENEVASVTLNGGLVRGPLSAGLHYKLPVVEHAYKVQVSARNLVIHDVTGKTANNQRVTFEDMNVTWHIAREDANTAMFKVGGMGTEGIAENFVPVIQDRTLRVLGRYTTIDINAKKEQIANEVKAEAAPVIHQMFGVTLDSVQIPKIVYDRAFEESVAAAVNAQNQAVQAEAQLKAIRVQAEQQEAQARGRAAAQVAAAEADARQKVLAAESAATARALEADAEAHATEVQAVAQAHATTLTARANADATRLSGEAEGAALTAKVSAFGGGALYNASLAAGALGKWNGSVPQMVLGGDKGLATFLPLAMPTPVVSR
jgi:regulator of protease activity HflC (stomatin/prohibitin superfamily)